jgi:hypothetical protein
LIEDTLAERIVELVSRKVAKIQDETIRLFKERIHNMTEKHDVAMQKLIIANIALRDQVENQRIMYEGKLTV